MIKYQENRNDIIQSVEIDLTGISAQSRHELEDKITKYLKDKDRSIFKFEAGNKLLYETEVLIPKINKDRLNVLMVFGNPAISSVARRMFFSYEKTGAEGKWREHRFWRALRDCDVLTFYEDVEKPTPDNIARINKYKRDCLLNGECESDFNIFLLPYFSFPTLPWGKYGGVDGIAKIVGKDIFKNMKEFEFRRFESVVLCNDIKNVICFQATARKEIIEKARGKQISNILNDQNYPFHKLGNTLEHVTLYKAGITRLIHTNKGKNILKDIFSDIRTKNMIGCS